MAMDLRFPIDLGSGINVDPGTVAFYYNHTEVKKAGGYFPIGTNTVWHGGLHIHTSKLDTPVFACADGKIVAVRLPEEKEKAHGHYGSRSFILIKHVFHGAEQGYTNTLLEGHKLRSELVRAHPGYGTPAFPGYGYGTGQYVCTTYCAEVLRRSGYTDCAPGEELYKIINIYDLPEEPINIRTPAVDNVAHIQHWRSKGVLYALATPNPTAQGTEITDLNTVQTGDFLQYWWKVGAKRKGHGVQVEEHFSDGLVSIHSSHGNPEGISVSGKLHKLKNEYRIYAVRPKGNKTEIYYSLYMHLNNGPIEGDKGYLKKIKWLKRWVGDDDTVTVQGSSKMYWVYEGTTNTPKEIGEFNEGAKLTKTKTVGTWEKVKFRTDDPNITFTNAWMGEYALAYVATSDLKPYSYASKLADLKEGKVVEPNVPVKAGEQIWGSGEYGSPGYRANLIHWEIFSENNLFPPDQFPNWKKVEDTDEDFNMDCQSILDMVDQEWFGFDSVLSFGEIKDFYTSQNSKISELRRTACKFMSEWGIPDLEKAIDDLKGVWFTGHLEERIRSYLWWSEAKALAQAKSKRKVWHYNPVTVLEQLTDYYKDW